MDNASSNDQLIQNIARSLQRDGILFNPEQRRLRCTGHIINLVVQAFLFGKKEDDYKTFNETTAPSEEQLDQWRRFGPLGKLYNIVVWITASPQRIQLFKKLSNGLMPRRDNGTRWNSWYEMLHRAINHLKTAILQTVHEEPSLAKDALSFSDWQTLINIRDFL